MKHFLNATVHVSFCSVKSRLDLFMSIISKIKFFINSKLHELLILFLSHISMFLLWVAS